MNFTIARLGIVALTFVLGLPFASGLDFEREIAKQQKTVKVRYKRAPKSIVHFMHHYKQCKSFFGVRRSRCNASEAKRHYRVYTVAWEQKQRRQVAMSTGEFQISLERKDKSEF